MAKVNKKEMACNKPKKTPSHPTKSHVVKACEGGKEKVIRFGQQGVSGSFPVSSLVDNVITPGQWIIPSLRMDADNSTPANRAIGNVNGGANITGNTSSAPPNVGDASFPMHIGAGIFSGGFYGYLLGAVSEIIFVNSVLSTDNRQRLEGYLAWKWALEANLPAGHPFKSAPPFV